MASKKTTHGDGAAAKSDGRGTTPAELSFGRRLVGVVVLLCESCLAKANNPFCIDGLTSVTVTCRACGALIPAGPIGGGWASFAICELDHIREPRPYQLQYGA